MTMLESTNQPAGWCLPGEDTAGTCLVGLTALYGVAIIRLMAKRDQDSRDELSRRLRRLGLVRGKRALSTPSPRRRVAIESLVDGIFHETPHGRCFVARSDFTVDHPQGDLPLGSFLDISPDVLATIGGEPALQSVDLTKAVFLDTETTGLSGGTGTMAFVVGLGFFEKDGFQLHQVFMRDPGDEPSMVHLLEELLAQFTALVTFNGRAFDVPILETRFTLSRRRSPLSGMPHLDLLPPARRMWRLSLPSCALGVLEQEVLGIRRDQADVPSGEIPQIYRDYLRTGDARDVSRILYHNQVDILSLVVLAARLGRIFESPWDEPDLSGTEYYSLARWHDRLGGEVEPTLRIALSKGVPTDLRPRVLHDLAALLKRKGRRGEALEWWQQLALESELEIDALVELAKTFEWHLANLPLAVGWTQVALKRTGLWRAGPRRAQALAELEHRLKRLQRKQEGDTNAE